MNAGGCSCTAESACVLVVERITAEALVLLEATGLHSTIREKSMFEVGRRYRITTSDHDGTGSSSATVVAWEAPLLKLESLGSYEVLNTSAPQFVSAEPDDEAHRSAQTKAAKDIVDSFSVKFAEKDG